MGVVQLALEGGADPNEADEVMINVCRVVVSHDGVTVQEKFCLYGLSIQVDHDRELSR